MADSIVVTGWGMVTPLGGDSKSTWKALFGGRNAMTRLKGKEWELFEEPRAAQAFELSVSEKLSRRDRSLRLGVAAAEEAWKKAELFNVPRDRIGTTFSSSKGGLLSLFSTGFEPNTGWDFLNDFFPHAAGQLLKQWFGLCGPSLSVSSACSTGIGSIAEGARLLLDGECDVVIAGSTESSIHPLIYAAFRNMGLFSDNSQGPSPFDVDRDGFLMGEGAGAVVLEREESARERKAPLLAKLSGWALGADAHEALEMEPQGKSIVPVIEKSLKAAGLKPQDIGYINAHGTGTRLNDRVESKAIESVFGNSKTWVSSTKGATGHLLGAAGSVEAILSALALTTEEIPETRNLSNPDPECRVRHVEKGGVKQKMDNVMSLSYGFGGQLGAIIFSKT